MSQAAKHIIFKGHVQGVGFRYTTQRIASQFPVTGYVRNQPDGSVEAVIQGEEGDIQSCLAKIQDYFGSHIRGIDISPMVYNSHLKDFDITF
ncbi:MAG: acylphosphatase [Planctomycetes bacterium]|nr:acylphosphatase [Planctomycetota bacterium]